MSLVNIAYRPAAFDYHALGALAAHPKPILWATPSGYCSALCLVGVVPSCLKSLNWRRNNSHLNYFIPYNMIIWSASWENQITWVFSPPSPSPLQKCVSVHKWHWSTPRLEPSRAIIMLLVHSLPIPASPYEPHSLVRCGELCRVEVVPSSRKSLKWRRSDSKLLYFTLYNIIICAASNGGQTTWLLSALVRSHL